MTTIWGSAAGKTGEAISKFGLATILALGFFYWLTSSVEADIKEIKKSQLEHSTEAAYYMWRVCLNTAQDDASRAACIPPASTRH